MYIGFSNIHSFRHPLGILECISHEWGRLLYLLLEHSPLGVSIKTHPQMLSQLLGSSEVQFCLPTTTILLKKRSRAHTHTVAVSRTLSLALFLSLSVILCQIYGSCISVSLGEPYSVEFSLLGCLVTSALQ